MNLLINLLLECVLYFYWGSESILAYWHRPFHKYRYRILYIVYESYCGTNVRNDHNACAIMERCHERGLRLV